ncbi:MAG: PQQ-binding-like beta-propeller repeat protein, partial [Planctomycetaceae bacterium]|nr:PQQ-binding-like beta-propeller repeat protein [Planctomycetaceae bacterium]
FLIVNCDGMDRQFVVALDKHTGKVAWWTWRSGPLSPEPDQQKAYATPLVIRVGEAEQLVSPGADWLTAYDPLTGGEIWKVHYKAFSTVPRPLFAHGLVYFVTGFTKPELWAVRPDGRGNVTESHVVWKSPKQVPANPSPIVVGSEIYFVSDQGVCTCLDALTGEEVWRQRVPGKYSASPILAGGLLYFSNEEGTTSVIRPGREFELVATNAIEGQLLASLVAVDGVIFLRSDTHLYRIENRPPTTTARGE